VADVDLFRNSKGPVTVVRGKDGKLVVISVEASTQNGEKPD
jgi:hypothetical protein